MKVETYKCDVCGKAKGEVNHWWLVSRGSGSFALRPWRDELADSAHDHICGAECVQKKVNEFVSSFQQKAQE